MLSMAGPEGLEPPTPGFGVRCTTNCATGLQELADTLLFTHSVLSVLTTRGTKLLDGKVRGY